MIKLNHVRIGAWSREAKGKKMFKHRKPTVMLTKLPGEAAELYVDFLERWHFCAGGGGWDKRGKYESLCFDNQDEANPKAPYDGFEIKLYFNKDVHIIGHNDKKCWYGYVQSWKSYAQCHRLNRRRKTGQNFFHLGKSKN